MRAGCAPHTEFSFVITVHGRSNGKVAGLAVWVAMMRENLASTGQLRLEAGPTKVFAGYINTCYIVLTLVFMSTTSVQPNSPSSALQRPDSQWMRDVMSPSTERAYRGALRRLNDWLDGRMLDDTALAGYVDHLADTGRAYPSGTVTVSAVRYRCRADGSKSAVGPHTVAALKRFRRTALGRGWGQARGLTSSDVAAILETACNRRVHRRSGRIESESRARRRGRVDAAIVAVLFQGGLRRSEAASLRWGDISQAQDGGVLIRVRRSKTDPNGSRGDVRYLKGDCAKAVLKLRADANGVRHPERLVFGGLKGATLAKRLAAAAANAGVEGRITGHSGRVGLAAELTARGAPMQAVMLAGNWKSPAMVAHYSAAASAERGAVAKYL